VDVVNMSLPDVIIGWESSTAESYSQINLPSVLERILIVGPITAQIAFSSKQKVLAL